MAVTVSAMASAAILANSDDWLSDCRRYLAAVQSQLQADFDPHAPVTPLLAARSDAIDGVLARLWQIHVAPSATDGVALLAVGGYGRGELFPYSDVDVLVLSLHPLDAQSPLCAGVTALVSALWDVGLQVGHSVRTLKECAEEARGDVTVMTTLMECRHLCGDPSLVTALKRETDAAHMWPAADYFSAKLAEQRQRYTNFGHIEYRLEPNVKTSPGGLRDAQLLNWVALRALGSPIDAVAGDSFLHPQERDILRNGTDFLSRVRFALHLLGGRDENRLLFDAQRKLAQQWGLTDGDKLAVEQFMQTYFRWVQMLAQLNDVLLRLFNKQLLRDPAAAARRTIDDDFEQVDDLIAARRESVFKDRPVNIFRLFVLIANNPDIEGVEPDTLRLLRSSRELIDEDFRADPEAAQWFMQLLTSPHNMTKQLRRLWRNGLLGRYLPEFGSIIGQMQFDLFHAYTVDAHTMEVVAFTRRFSKADFTDKFPVSTRIAQRLRRPVLLYIAALYHDIGKGRGGDHSELGAVDAEAFCRRHSLDARDTELVVWLVRNHLLMSTVSQRRDISDPEEIQRFAGYVATEERLDYLYTLTVADINGTNPDLWNAWRASLLRQLYTETRRALRRGLSNPLGRRDVVIATRRAAADLLEYRGFLVEELDALWQARGDDYFLRERPEDIAWHTEALADHTDLSEPLVLVRQAGDSPVASATQIFLHAKDEPNLFAKTCAALETMGLSINDARIYSGSDGATLDTFYVLQEDGSPVDDSPDHLQWIGDTLSDALKRGDLRCGKRRTPRTLQSFQIPTDIQISQDSERGWTVLELAARDRPGLLAELGFVFAQQQVAIQAAKIQTLGERIEDVFFITDLHGGPIIEPTRIEQLCAAIGEQLEVPGATTL